MSYDINDLRDLTYKYTKDHNARIPCPDCHNKKIPTLVEDQPFAAAVIFYCPLCDGKRYITKARALAILPCLAEHIKKLKGK